MFDYKNGKKYSCISVYSIIGTLLLSLYIPYEYSEHNNTDEVIKAKAEKYGTITEIIKTDGRISQITVISL